MKRILTILAIALAAFSCSKEQTKEYGTYSFAVGISSDTKAPLVADGTGEHVNRCIMEIYRGEELYDRLVSPVTAGNASFSPSLIMYQTYQIVLWADCGNDDRSDLYYNTETLSNISFKGTYKGSNDKMDAFCKTFQFTAEDAGTSSIQLTRPFAQVNTCQSTYTEGSITVYFDAPASYNAKDDIPGTSQQFSYTNTQAYSSAAKVLSMDYIFAKGESTIGITVNSNVFQDIPIKRNSRTNIIF